MAALKPVSSEEIQPATRPLEAEEAEAAEDWPGLQLGPTSWIERGQIWSLELQPYDATTSPEGMADLETAFRKYAVFGDTSASGNDMTSKNFSKMMKECGVMDGKLVTSTDVDILFSKVKTKGARNITYPEFLEALKELSVKRFKGKSPEEALQATHQLLVGKDPSLVGATKSVTAGAVDRLTDTSKYTGSHKERFDESGKGKGIAGRADLAQNTGYVGAYKGAGTYDKSH
ncbi:tubulin polymerization-promoting protein family member 2 isoform X2 [Pogona vitticeps]